ncbi:MAG: hypothetical protein HUU02_03240 [Bacteroidetes bacterium]|nr:hypothetical protein [Bacteroidota bacterium]
MTPEEQQRYGLCASCRHRETVRSARGSEFILCGRSATDRTFPKYPRLPVPECRGYEPSGSSGGQT